MNAPAIAMTLLQHRVGRAGPVVELVEALGVTGVLGVRLGAGTTGASN